MQYAIQINTSPYASNAGLIAYRFIKAALLAQHQVLQVFFYQEGIQHAFKYALPPDDELNISRLWSQLAEEYPIDLLVCISAAQRRGLLCADEARRHDLSDDYLAAGFRIGGLGQWLEASLKADRCLVFG